MGLAFHYKGRLKKARLLPSLVDEVEDICQIMDWKTTVFETEYPQNKFVSPIDAHDYGIIFTPPECEPVCLVFDSEGRLYVPWLKDLLKKNEDGEIKVITVQLNLDDEGVEPIISERNEDFDHSFLVYQAHVKTQYAGAEIHIKVIELMKYLSSKYLIDFELEDESQYYETGDAEKLIEKLGVINEFLETFNDLLSKTKIESPKDFIKLLKKVSRQNKSKDKGENG